MYIHTVKSGENLYKIAKEYGISPAVIARINELSEPEKLSVGEKLLILTPTRTYQARGGESLIRIADRFSVPYKGLIRANPGIIGRSKALAEEVLALKFDTPAHGPLLINGYYYSGCSRDRLALILPYLSHLTLSSYKADARGLSRILNDSAIIKEAKKHSKKVLMRVYDAAEDSADIRGEDFFQSLIFAAERSGYDGITFCARCASKSISFAQQLGRFREMTRERGLLLFTEVDGNSGARCPDDMDGYVIFYESAHPSHGESFATAEEVYKKYSEIFEGERIFIDFSPFAYADGQQIPKKDAERLAYEKKCEIKYDDEKMICRFEYRDARKYGGCASVCYESLENTKAKLDLIGELGFRGASIDVMRSPLKDIMMMNSIFAPINQSLI